MKSSRLIMPLLVVLFSSSIRAQQDQPMFTGIYLLEGVMETASGFRVNPDSSFDFFYSYGAIDRYGKGTFVFQGDSIVLQSAPKPERDFILHEVKKIPETGFFLKVSDPNPMVVSHIRCLARYDDGREEEGATDSGGELYFPAGVVKRILLQHPFWPERVSGYDIDASGNNFYEFTIDPRIVEVDFNGIVLRLAGERLEGPHPLIPGREFRYTKKQD